MQTENGDPRRKCYDIFPQIVIPDLFMERVEKNEQWTLFDPYELNRVFGIDFAELYGDEFERLYHIAESKVGTDIKLSKVIDARKTFVEIMRTQIETGLPYLCFKDTINKANPNKHRGIIPSTNLCVVGETMILTNTGYIRIDELVHKDVNIWNGEKWSNVTVFPTGNARLVRVTLSNGVTIDCTNNHKFPIKNNRHKFTLIDAQDLIAGYKLIKYELPIATSPTDVPFPYAYTHGYYCTQKTKNENVALPELSIPNDYQTALLPHIKRRTYQFKDTVIGDTLSLVFNEKTTICKLPVDIAKKFVVPLNGYTLQSRLDWLSGLFDRRAGLIFNTGNTGIQIPCKNIQFLRDVRLLLQTLGVDSRISNTLYKGHTYYRLLINSYNVSCLVKLGFKTNVLPLDKIANNTPNRSSSEFVTVVSVEDLPDRGDTYCFTEPDIHLGMFNGLLLGNCTESYSVVVPGKEAHSCNLISINLANVTYDEVPYYSKLAVRLLDNTIDMTTSPFADAKAHNHNYRTVGVGVMGLADMIAKNNSSYQDIGFINLLFEHISYNAVHSSVELAAERGFYPAYEGSEWSKGLLVNSRTPDELNLLQESSSPYDWNELAKLVDIFGIRNSHILAVAPNTSSSLIQGCTASILPVFSKFFLDKASKGTCPIAPPFIADHGDYYQENKTLDQKAVINLTAVAQRWIDTGISMELLFNLNKNVYWADQPNRSLTAKEIFNLLLYAWQNGVKAIYYIRTVPKDDFEVTVSTNGHHEHPAISQQTLKTMVTTNA